MLAHSSDNTNKVALLPCGRTRCKLCGGSDGKGMINSTDVILITTTNGTLTKVLKYADWGIYTASCKICHHKHVGQTIDEFSLRCLELTPFSMEKWVVRK